MVKVFCWMVGGGGVFNVLVNEAAFAGDYSVDDLKDAIKDKKPLTITGEADQVQLFLAKTKRGEWLDRDGAAAVTYEEDGGPPFMLDEEGKWHYFLLMDPLLYLKNANHFGNHFEPGEGQVHVLVVVPVSAPVSGDLDVRSNLNRLRVPFATRDLNYLLNRDVARYSSLRSTALTSVEAATILAFARSAIKSATRNAIGTHEGVMLDGPLNLRQGQGKSGFYYAYSRFGGILVAKVYGAMHRQAFQREVDVNHALGSHMNIVQFLKSFSITNTENEQRHIIVMPFFARSVADLLTQHSPVELRALAIIARDCVSALCHIHSKNYCFADLKPANIMLHCGEQGGATLVDFGGAVELGAPIVETTDQFCLDVAKSQGSELLDWTCLGTTVAQLADIDITQYNSRQELVIFLNGGQHAVNKLVEHLIISCLVEPCRSRIEAALAPLLNSFCKVCQCKLTKIVRPRHHCRKCSYSVCGEHFGRKLHVPPDTKPVRVCDTCFTLFQSEHAEEEEKIE